MELNKTRGIAKWLLVGLWSWFGITVFFGSLPDSPMRLAKNDRTRLLSVLPEGWGFFTRSPREEEIALYARTPHGWSLVNFRAASAASCFGITRTSRVQGVELAGLVSQVPDKAWTGHPDPLAVGAALDSIPLIAVDNVAVRKTACGELLAAKKRPIPWAWSRSGQPVDMPGVYVRLAVDCNAPPPANDPDASLLDAVGASAGRKAAAAVPTKRSEQS